MLMFFVTGPNGVGKSAIIPHLKDLLPADQFEVRDFDERGVPENAGSTWRASETQHWIEAGRGLAEQNKQLVVCGFVKLKDFGEAAVLLGKEISVVHLDVTPEILRQRLEQRYSVNGVYDPSQTVIGKPLEEFISGNLYVREKLRQEYEAAGVPVIDTSNLTPAEAARQVAALCVLR